MSSSKQKKLKIGIQGVKASFHDVAARRYFSDASLETIECASFLRLCEVLKSGEADFALMAIENSIAGSILTNYGLLERFEFKVIGEVYLRIEMSLMALAGQDIAKLQFVQSHPMALLQCTEFLALHPQMKVLEGTDTAESAKIIRDRGLTGYAAIAHHLAAEVYGLEVLERGIETNKQNYTRFLVISRGESYRENEEPNKASLRFEISHRPGSLVATLAGLNSAGVNMTKIQSVPILGRPYEYSFHVDIEWESEGTYREAMRELEMRVVNLIHFGDYKKGEWAPS